MPVTPSLTKQGIHLLIEYRKKIDTLIKNSSAKEIHPQCLAADNLLHIITEAANGILWPFLQNILINKKELDKNLLILFKVKETDKNKKIINIIDNTSLVLGDLIIELLMELKDNTSSYIDPGTSVNTIGPLISSLMGDEIKVENKEQLFAVIQYQLIMIMIDIKNEMDNYKNNLLLIKQNEQNTKIKKININQILLPIVLNKSPQENIAISLVKNIPDDPIFKNDQSDQACQLQEQKKGKATQVSNLLVLLDKLTHPEFLHTWPLIIPEELSKIIFSPCKELYMAVTLEQKYQVIKRIITDVYLCSNIHYKSQIREKIKSIPKSINQFFFKKPLDNSLPLSVYEIKYRYITLLKKNPGIFPVRLAIEGLIKALHACQYRHQLYDIIKSVTLLQKNLENSHLNSQKIFKALCYEMILSLKMTRPAAPALLDVPESKRTHAIFCLNNLLNICRHSTETHRVYYLAECALNKTKGHLKNKIISITANLKIENIHFSSLEVFINNQMILLLQDIIYREQNQFSFFNINLYDNSPYYIDFSNRLLIKLFVCQIQKDLVKIQNEIDNMQTVFMVNEDFSFELKNVLKKIKNNINEALQNEQGLLEEIKTENITASLKKC